MFIPHFIGAEDDEEEIFPPVPEPEDDRGGPGPGWRLQIVTEVGHTEATADVCLPLLSVRGRASSKENARAYAILGVCELGGFGHATTRGTSHGSLTRGLTLCGVGVLGSARGNIRASANTSTSMRTRLSASGTAHMSDVNRLIEAEDEWLLTGDELLLE